MLSFSEKINHVHIPDQYKRNKSKIVSSVQTLKRGIDSMKPEKNTKAYDCIIDKETGVLRILPTNYEGSGRGGKSPLTLPISKRVEYSGITDTNVPYTITPRYLVKNLQSMYRDLSVFWFLDTENTSEILPFLAEHRFFTVVYSMEFHVPIQEPIVEPVKEPIVEPVVEPIQEPIKTEEPVVEPIKTEEPIKKPVFSYASMVRNNITVEPDTLSHNIDETTRSIPAYYRGGKYNKKEFENVREYYQKWGSDRMFVMFSSNFDHFTRNDKIQIRNLMNNDVFSDPKYQEIIRDNEYYFVKVIKNFHYDRSRDESSYHFNILFKNEYTASKVYHIYVNPQRTFVTRISTLNVDNR